MTDPTIHLMNDEASGSDYYQFTVRPSNAYLTNFYGGAW